MIGVNGVGKTTTKEFIAAVASRRYKTLKNEGNQNTEIGVPNTIWKLDQSHECAVIEMGQDKLDDILKLTMAVRPDIAVVTSVGTAHIEFLGSRENILRGKLQDVYKRQTSERASAALILLAQPAYRFAELHAQARLEPDGVALLQALAQALVHFFLGGEIIGLPHPGPQMCIRDRAASLFRARRTTRPPPRRRPGRRDWCRSPAPATARASTATDTARNSP